MGRSLKPFKRPWLWSGLWILAIAAVVIGSLLPSQDLPAVGVDDKLQHFVGYAVLSAGAVQLFVRRLSWGFVCVLLVLMGIGLEYLQAQMAMGRPRCSRRMQSTVSCNLPARACASRRTRKSPWRPIPARSSMVRSPATARPG